ncbi:hypothetical protein ACFRCG_39255 [Embleya sp. NPDC056575]|uniref:hypothetical protein n=1 Tax=unclassified Embleya TaxID=2699296 RepID=UPI0036C18A6F
MTTQVPTTPDRRAGPRSSWALARAEATRLTSYRSVRWALYALPVIVIAYGLSRLLLHDTDVATAWTHAEAEYQKALLTAPSHGLDISSVSAANWYHEPRYMTATEAFVDMRALMSALGAAALGLGIIAGGADWTSRVMLTLSTAEPRRGALFAVRAVLTAAIAAGAATCAGILLVPTLLLAGRWKGSLNGLDADFWTVLAGQYTRGIVYVSLMGLLGYALAMLLRRTSAALAVAFVYLAFAEQLISDYAPDLDERHLQGVTFAILNDKPVIPLADSVCMAGPGCEAIHVDLTQTDGFLTLLAYVLPVLLAAAWRHTRTDIG